MKHGHPFFAWVKNFVFCDLFAKQLFGVQFLDIFHWLVGLEEKTWIGNTTVLDLVSIGVVIAYNLVVIVIWRRDEINSPSFLTHLRGITILTFLAVILFVLRVIEILPG